MTRSGRGVVALIDIPRRACFPNSFAAVPRPHRMQDRSGGVIFLLHWLPAGLEDDRALAQSLDGPSPGPRSVNLL